MGGVCQPDRGENCQMKDVEVKQVLEETEPSEKFANVIDAYQVENEKLRKELESMKSLHEEVDKASEQSQIEKLLKELAVMKEMLEVKDQALVKHQFKTALQSKSISIANSDSATKLIKAGSIKKIEPENSIKAFKWVEIYFHSGVARETGQTKGYLMLNVAETKDSQLVNRCKIIRLNENTDVKSKMLSVDVVVSGRENTLVFACEDEKETTSWIEAIDDGFRQIDEELSSPKTVNDDISQGANEQLGSSVQKSVGEAEDKGVPKQIVEERSALKTANDELILGDELSKESRVIENLVENEVEADEVKSADNEQVKGNQADALDEHVAKDQSPLVRGQTYRI